MVTALHIFLFGILLIMFLLLSYLFIPLSYNLTAVFVQQSVEFRFSVRHCCCGLKITRESGNIYRYLLLFGRCIKLKDKYSTKPQATRTVESRSKKNPSWSGLIELAWNSNLRQQLFYRLKKIWLLVCPQHINMNARIGFEEPHYTAWIMGLAAILQNHNQAYSISLEGVWDEPCIEGQGTISGKISLAMLLWQLIIFLLQPEIKSYIKRLRRQIRSAEPEAA